MQEGQGRREGGVSKGTGEQEGGRFWKSWVVGGLEDERGEGSYWEPNATNCMWGPAGKMLMAVGPKKTPVAQTLEIPQSTTTEG